MTKTVDNKRLNKLKNLLNKEGIDRIEWNNKMVEALRLSFDQEINNIDKQKETFDRLGLEYTAPHIYWDNSIENLINNSIIFLSAIAQNWYHKYWLIQAKQSMKKSKPAGLFESLFKKKPS